MKDIIQVILFPFVLAVESYWMFIQCSQKQKENVGEKTK